MLAGHGSQRWSRPCGGSGSRKCRESRLWLSVIAWMRCSRKSDFCGASGLQQCGAPIVSSGPAKLRRMSQFGPLYSRLAASALPRRRKSSPWISAGQSTGRKTALIGIVSSARLQPRVPALWDRAAIRTVLPCDDTSPSVEGAIESEAREAISVG